MKQSCPSCGTVIEIDEREFKGGDIVVRNCPLCDCAVEFMIPSLEKKNVVIGQKEEKERVIKRDQAAQKRIEELEKKIQDIEQQNDDKKNKNKKTIWPYFLFVGFLFVGIACVVLTLDSNERREKQSEEDRFYNTCKSASDYREYLNRYPEGQYSIFAANQIKKYEDDSIRELLDREGLEQFAYDECYSAAKCRSYLQKYPSGKYVTEVRDRLGRFVQDSINKAMEEESMRNGEIFDDEADADSKAGRLNVIVNGLAFDMIYVRGGSFKMGASQYDDNADDDEFPAHYVSVRDYYMGETEVTQAIWESVMGSNPSKFRGGDLPVEQVSWDDCQIFIRKLNNLLESELGGMHFALPSEAEWEYAARAGSNAALYNDEDLEIWSKNNAPNLGKYAWYSGNCGQDYRTSEGCDVAHGFDITKWPEKQYDDNIGGTHPVGKKQPNAWGFYDMLGNVWEWCDDWYHPYSSSDYDVRGSIVGTSRVFRGASWCNGAKMCRLSNRGSYTPDRKSSGHGIRLVLH